MIIKVFFSAHESLWWIKSKKKLEEELAGELFFDQPKFKTPSGHHIWDFKKIDKNDSRHI